MHREHEDHMRGDYDTFHRLGGELFETNDRPEIARIAAQRREIVARWENGPHAEQWAYLAQAQRDWRWTPNTMRRYLDGDAYNRPRAATELTEVQLRSHEQARRLTGYPRRPEPERTRPTPPAQPPAPRRGSGIERSR
ncbi:hypothetical protein ACTD5D_30965 [Nocardia takedensis]|uniref:hypothetical protein n=1 Tax=Nocardia takedensis TaxID=259390 RepID=UPI003F763E21